MSKRSADFSVFPCVYNEISEVNGEKSEALVIFGMIRHQKNIFGIPK